MTFLFCLSFLVDEFDCSLQCNRHRVFLLRDRHVLTVVENVWAEAACSDGYLATFEITQFARKLEEFQSFFQGNGLDTLVGWQLGELRLVLVIGSSNLYDRTETTNLNEYWASRLWIITKLSLASFMLAACVHHLVNLRLKFFVEVFHPLVPIGLTLGDVIKLLLHIGSEVVVHDAWKVFHQKVIDDNSDICRQKLSFLVASDFFLNLLCNLDAL